MLRLKQGIFLPERSGAVKSREWKGNIGIRGLIWKKVVFQGYLSFWP
jgi:hypothetical protein